MIPQSNATPFQTGTLISRAQMILEAATLHEADIALELNKPESMRAALVNLTGGTLNGNTVTGLLPAHNVARVEYAAARSRRKLVEIEARKFCGASVDLLKCVFGRTISPQWVALGFTNRSLAIPADCLKLLGEIRAYFERNPLDEHPARNLTAAAAADLANRLSTARSAVATAYSKVRIARETREKAEDELRYRVSTVPGELKLRLGPFDQRWYDFGYRRPVDDRLPLPVELVTLTSPHPGEVSVTWPAARRAQSYRVLVQERADAEYKEVRVTSETTLLLTGLGSGSVVNVRVMSINGVGETAVPAEGSILVT